MCGQRPTVQGKARPRYLVIGGACQDTFTTTTGPVAVGGKTRVRSLLRTGGGGGLNVAVGLKVQAPEAEVLLVAGTGDDAAGQSVRTLAADRGVGLPWGIVPGQPTSTSFIVTEAGSGRSTIFSETGARAEPVPLDLVEELLAGCDGCWLVAPTPSGTVHPVVTLAAKRGVPVFFGLGGSQIEGLGEQLSGPLALLMCNRQEAFGLTGKTRLIDQLEALSYGGLVRTVVISEGPSGLHALHEGHTVHAPAYSDHRDVVDETGAGDAAQSVIGRWLLLGQPLREALCAAARQGFEAVTALGATTRLLTEEELRAHVQQTDEMAA